MCANLAGKYPDTSICYRINPAILTGLSDAEQCCPWPCFGRGTWIPSSRIAFRGRARSCECGVLRRVLLLPYFCNSATRSAAVQAVSERECGDKNNFIPTVDRSNSTAPDVSRLSAGRGACSGRRQRHHETAQELVLSGARRQLQHGSGARPGVPPL
jgi:hypothetical protein